VAQIGGAGSDRAQRLPLVGPLVIVEPVIVYHVRSSGPSTWS
jgi:hypothetical protein